MNRQVATQVQASGGNPGQVEEPLIEIIDETEPQGGQQPAGGDQQLQQGRQATGVEDDDDDEPVGQRPGESEGEGAELAEGGDAQLTPRQRRRLRERQRVSLERAELMRLREVNARLIEQVQRTDARISNVEMSGLDSQIMGVQTEIDRAALVMKRAMEAQNPEDFMKAQEIRDVLRDRLAALKSTKQSAQQPTAPGMGQGGTPPQGAPGPNQVAPEQRRLADIFISRHPWFQLGSSDQDSQIVQTLDEQMMREGHNPRTPQYWMELERRVNDELPHRALPMNDNGTGGGQGAPQNNGGRQNGAAGGPRLPGSGNRGGTSGSAPERFHLSAARKQSLIDLGVWDNPTERNKYVKRFIEWDRQNGTK